MEQSPKPAGAGGGAEPGWGRSRRREGPAGGSTRCGEPACVDAEEDEAGEDVEGRKAESRAGWIRRSRTVDFLSQSRRASAARGPVGKSGPDSHPYSRRLWAAGQGLASGDGPSRTGNSPRSADPTRRKPRRPRCCRGCRMCGLRGDTAALTLPCNVVPQPSRWKTWFPRPEPTTGSEAFIVKTQS